MGKLILIRHGESEWNNKNLFTGWVDIPLSGKGIEEAIQAGELIKALPIDIIFTSTLIRAIMTAMLVMNQSESKKIPHIRHPHEGRLERYNRSFSEESAEALLPVHKSWQLNERMYGELQGMDKDEMRKRFGEEQVHIWRRSFATPPPSGESLKMTAERTLPYFEQEIVPQCREGKNVLVAAHGNSLRSIIMALDSLSEDEVVALELKTGVPVLYEFQDETFKKLPPLHASRS